MVSRGVYGICPRGWSFKSLSRGVRRSLSRGEWNNIEDCPGGWGKTEARPGGIYKSVPGGRGIIHACPGVFL